MAKPEIAMVFSKKLNRRMIPTYVPRADVSAKCPHCERVLEGVISQRLDEPLGKAYIWSCVHCHKVLGVSHRKGFWMG